MCRYNANTKKVIKVGRIVIILVLLIYSFCLVRADITYAADEVASGTCGYNVTWELDSEGTLTISGTGAMNGYGSSYGYLSDETSPWYSFRGRVKKVIIENGVTHIGTYAFLECENMTSIQLPEGLQSIDRYAFMYCRGLIGIDFPDSLASIGEYAFYGCSSLDNVSIPNQVTSIEAQTFKGCSGMKHISFPDTLSSIGNSSFEDCTSLIEVEIPEGVTKVGLSTFRNCTSLESAKLSVALTGINKECFYGCNNLSEVYIYENILAINENAFGSCENISNIYFNGTKELWDDIFIESGNDALSAADLHYKGAGQGEDYLIEHVWLDDYTIDKEATCTVDGSKSKHCANCDAITDVTVIPKTGHTYGDWKVTKEANCTEDGSKEKVCSVCGDTVTEVIPATGHTEEVLSALSPTCTETGLTEGKKCPVCGEILVVQETVAALGHDYHEVEGTAVVATCTTAGKHADQKCSRCDSMIEGEAIAASGHTEEVLAAVNPTCTEAGLTEGKKCSVCGEILVAQETVAALGHDYHEVEGTAVEATCITAGKHADQKCTRCDSVIEGEAIAALGHDWSEWTVVKEATEDEEGLEVRVCGRDATHTEEKVIPKLNHTHNLVKTDAVAATCTVDGNIEYWTCSKCGRIYSDPEGTAEIDKEDTVIRAFGHTEEVLAAVAPTCTETGLTEGKKCSVCGEILIAQETVAALGHDWGEWTVVKEATEDEEGLEVRVCGRDATHIEEKVIPKLDHTHNLVKTDAVAATCTADGNIEYWTCSKCGRIYSDPEGTAEIDKEDTVIRAFGHTEEVLAAVAPTCTETGLTEGKKCSVCGEILVAQETVATLGHDWSEWVVIKEATTTEEGLERRTCLRDESHFEERAIPKKVPEKTGWIKEDGYWYFYESDGTMAVSVWKKDSKGWCYLAEDGRMVTNGWAKDSKGWCWIGSAGYMIEKTQWIKVDDNWYYINKGYMVTKKWMKDSKGWCYVGEDGIMVANGWAPDSKGLCYMDSTGHMLEKTQWVKCNGEWYHITKGYMDKSKWMKDSQGWCWLQEDGRMLTNGWAKDSKGWCWIGDSGYMVTDTKWIDVDGVRYYIKKGYMAVNCWAKDDNGWLYLGPDGLPVTGTWKKDTKGWCYVGDDGYMVTNDFVKDTKGWCWIGEAGYMIEEDMWIGEAGAEGSSYIIKGYRVDDQTIEIDGVEYTFDAGGKLVP